MGRFAGDLELLRVVQREISDTRKDLRKMIAKAVRYQMKCDRDECKKMHEVAKDAHKFCF